MSAEDMAKIGQLCLDKGVAGGKQIVSYDWIRQMTAPTHITDEKFRNMMYGYLWWVLDDKKQAYAAVGNSGNIIYVDEKSVGRRCFLFQANGVRQD